MILGSNQKMGMNGMNLEWNGSPELLIDSDRQLFLMAQAGVKWLRFPFYMSLSQPSRGVYTLNTYDYIVNKAKSYGMNIIALMAFHVSQDWSNGGHGNYSSWPVLPEYYAEWIAYIGARYEGKISHFEMGNEPDVTGFWLPAVNYPAYTAAMKTAYTALKAVRPDAVAISAGWTGISPRTVDAVTSMYANGGKDYFDALGLHLYQGGTSNAPSFNIVDTVRGIMNANGDNAKPIIITEIGFYTGSATGARTETEQANYIKTLYREILTGSHQDIPFLVYYGIKDRENNLPGSEDNYGVIHNQNFLYPYLPKPSFYAYQEMAGMGKLMPTFFTNYSPNIFNFYDNFDRANGPLGILLTKQSWYSVKFSINTNKAKNTPTLDVDLVSNGDFSTDTAGWTAIDAILSVDSSGDSGSCLKVTNNGANRGYAYQVITTEIGQYYRVDIKYKNGTSVSRHRAGISPTDTSYFDRFAYSSASWTGRAYYFRATTTTSYIALGTDSFIDGDTEFYDSIIVNKVILNEMFATVVANSANPDISINNTNVQWSNNGLIVNLDSVSDPKNFVLVTENYNKNTLKIEKCVNGVFTLVLEQGVIPVIGSEVRVDKNGTSYQLYYNGVPKGAVQTISDPEIINNKIHGMWLPDNQASLDNFLIRGK